jgi:hypothetical protein
MSEQEIRKIEQQLSKLIKSLGVNEDPIALQILDKIQYHIIRTAKATDLPEQSRRKTLEFARRTLATFQSSGINQSRYSFVDKYIFEKMAEEIFFNLPRELQTREH